MNKLQTVGRSLSLSCAGMLAACGASQPSAMLGAFAQTAMQRPANRPAANCPVDHHGTGILPDGDFSQTPDPGNGLYDLRRGQSFAPAWTVAKRTVDFVGSVYWNVGRYCSVDLDGIRAGGISSASFATKRGKSYQVSFLFSGNGAIDRYDPATKTMSLQAEKQIHVFTWNVSNGNDAQNGKFLQQTWTFQADRTTTALIFLSHDHKKSAAGPVVADISVVRK
jgi:Protein of unknown function (DUF642)